MWEVRSAGERSGYLADLLASGWEPFAVTGGTLNATIWLRKRMSP